MALSRSYLKSMGLSDEQVNSIIEAHSETVEGLKAERDKYKADADKLPEVQKQLDALTGEDWKGKFERERKDFADYKADVANKERLGKVKAAYRQVLEGIKVGKDHIDSIMEVTDFSKMKLGDDGKLDDADNLTENAKKRWSGFITTQVTKGANVATPPSSNMKSMTREEIYARDEHGRYKLDATARQEQLAKLLASEE